MRHLSLLHREAQGIAAVGQHWCAGCGSRHRVHLRWCRPDLKHSIIGGSWRGHRVVTLQVGQSEGFLLICARSSAGLGGNPALGWSAGDCTADLAHMRRGERGGGFHRELQSQYRSADTPSGAYVGGAAMRRSAIQLALRSASQRSGDQCSDAGAKVADCVSRASRSLA